MKSLQFSTCHLFCLHMPFVSFVIVALFYKFIICIFQEISFEFSTLFTVSINKRFIDLFQVKFNLKPEIHVMVKWTYAYRTARIGHWERAARDRFRFKERISKTEKTLGYIFNIQHRSQVWEQRFQTEDCK